MFKSTRASIDWPPSVHMCESVHWSVLSLAEVPTLRVSRPPAPSSSFSSKNVWALLGPVRARLLRAVTTLLGTSGVVWRVLAHEPEKQRAF